MGLLLRFASILFLTAWITTMITLVNMTLIVQLFTASTVGTSPRYGMWSVEKYLDVNPIINASFIVSIIGAGLVFVSILSFLTRLAERRFGNEQERNAPRTGWAWFSFFPYALGKVLSVVALAIFWVALYLPIGANRTNDSFYDMKVQIMYLVLSGVCVFGVVLDILVCGMNLRNLFGTVQHVQEDTKGEQKPLVAE